MPFSPIYRMKSTDTTIAGRYLHDLSHIARDISVAIPTSTGTAHALKDDFVSRQAYPILADAITMDTAPGVVGRLETPTATDGTTTITMPLP
jgi:hypothetical protein